MWRDGEAEKSCAAMTQNTFYDQSEEKKKENTKSSLNTKMLVKRCLIRYVGSK